MTNYDLTVCTNGYSTLRVGIGQAPRTGRMVPHFPRGYRKGLSKQHAEVLRSAAFELASAIELNSVPQTLTGTCISSGDQFPVRWSAPANQ